MRLIGNQTTDHSYLKTLEMSFIDIYIIFQHRKPFKEARLSTNFLSDLPKILDILAISYHFVKNPYILAFKM